MSQRAAPLKAKTLQKQTPSRGKREKQTTTQITRMGDQRTEARRLEKKNEKKLTGPRSFGTRKTTYERRSRRDARLKTYATTKNNERGEAMDVERKYAHEATAEKKKRCESRSIETKKLKQKKRDIGQDTRCEDKM